MRDFSDKVAVVTGGGSGIGRGIALGLAAEKMVVAVCDIQSEAADAVASEITARGGRAIAIGVDVTSRESLSTAASAVEQEIGKASLLCANAGVMARVGPLAAHSAEDWEYTFSVNVFGIVKTVQAFLPHVRANAPEAHIVCTASEGGLMSGEGFPVGAYVSSKYACVGYSEVLRRELSSEGIGVSVLCPSAVASNLIITSTTNRPRAFGEQPENEIPAMDGHESQADTLAAMAAATIEAEDVGPILIDAVRGNRLHVLTHPERSRHGVEERFRELLGDFAFASKT